MASFSARLVRLYISWIRNPKAIHSSALKTRDTIQNLFLRPASYNPPQSLPSGISIDRVDVNDWPLYRVSSSESKDERDAMLYIHGGAWYKEIDPQHWAFIIQAAKETGLDVLVPIYPLVPRPAATAARLAEGFMEVFRLSPQRIVCIAGDSAGGMLALVAAQQLRKRQPKLADQLKSLVLISPALDTTFSHPELSILDKDDPWLATEGIKVVTPHLAAGLPADDPLVSPLFGDIEGLPPTMLLSGTHDILCSDARRLSAKYQGKDIEQGLPGSYQSDRFTFIEKPEMIHVYPILPHAEGAEARELIMHFIKKHV